MKRAAVVKLGIGGGLVVAVLASGVAWLFTRDGDSRTWRYWQKRLPQSMAEAQAAGIPMLEENHPVAGSDGAPLLSDLCFRFKTGRPSYYAWGRDYHKGGAARKKVLAECRSFEPYAPQIRSAWESDYFTWPTAAAPAYVRLNDARQTAWALINWSVVQAELGDVSHLEPAFATLQRALDEFANSGYSSGLGQVDSLRSRAAELLILLARNPRVSPERFESLCRKLEIPSVTYQHALRFEPATYEPEVGTLFFYYPREEWELGIREPVKYADLKTFMQAPVSAQKESLYSVNLHHWTKAWPSLDRPISDINAVAFDRVVSTPIGSGHCWPIEMAGPQLYSVSWRNYRMTSILFLTAARIQLFRRVHGTWPKTAEGLGQDPWSGKTLRTLFEKKRFWVWSEGENRVNDWGHGAGHTPPGDDWCYYSESGSVSN